MIKVCTSGYFNPVHIGHINLFKEAKSLGDHLTVIVNNDEQVKLKGSIPFMSEIERCQIIEAIKYVDEVILSVDQDNTVAETLRIVQPDIFAKGGDSTGYNLPSTEVFAVLIGRPQAKIVCNVGGGKIQSSSWLKEKI